MDLPADIRRIIWRKARFIEAKSRLEQSYPLIKHCTTLYTFSPTLFTRSTSLQVTGTKSIEYHTSSSMSTVSVRDTSQLQVVFFVNQHGNIRITFIPKVDFIFIDNWFLTQGAIKIPISFRSRKREACIVFCTNWQVCTHVLHGCIIAWCRCDICKLGPFLDIFNWCGWPMASMTHAHIL